jgi:hypothetical protein
MDAADDNVISDGGGFYVDGQERVKCSTGDLRGQNLSGIGLGTMAKGNINKFRERQLDMAFSSSNEEGYIAYPTEGLPDSFFNYGDGNPETFDTEDAWLAVRPYEDQGHIQNLPPGLYRMALDIRFLAADYRFVLSMASRAVPDDRFQGVVCDITPQSDAETDDVSVIVWAPEDAPNRYTVTTGQVEFDEEYQTWVITDGATRAALCSSVPIDGVCGGPGSSDMCNKMGWVDVQFTLHADDLP